MVFDPTEWVMVFIAVLMICISVILSGRWISRSIETVVLAEAAPAPADQRQVEAKQKLEELRKQYPEVKFEDLKIKPAQ